MQHYVYKVGMDEDTVEYPEGVTAFAPRPTKEGSTRVPKGKTMSLREQASKAGQVSTAQRNNPERVCGAALRDGSGRVCRNWAGLRTDHPGTGYCYLHQGGQA